MQTLKYAPTLFIPSLLSDTYINVYNCTKGEAISFVEHFNSQVAASRKVAAAPNAVADVMDFTTGSLNLEALVEDESLSELVTKLSTSELRGQRGRRCVFVDIDSDEIGVGTTVVYNENRAMTGVLDTTVATSILDAVTEAEDA